ncbi:hypothetical protein GGX14DRAFT_637389 [Mycena pura]|uniref:Uncharacterized protein n=1 Tax=Mycena pura TaxID=153505 RepID=A0AAD6VGL0_9AGAR|nr:hypothetical protein GGX14DRAFT_637389 [Mycena pura]
MLASTRSRLLIFYTAIEFGYIYSPVLPYLPQRTVMFTRRVLIFCVSLISSLSSVQTPDIVISGLEWDLVPSLPSNPVLPVCNDSGVDKVNIISVDLPALSPAFSPAYSPAYSPFSPAYHSLLDPDIIQILEGVALLVELALLLWNSVPPRRGKLFARTARRAICSGINLALSARVLALLELVAVNFVELPFDAGFAYIALAFAPHPALETVERMTVMELYRLLLFKARPLLLPYPVLLTAAQARRVVRCGCVVALSLYALFLVDVGGGNLVDLPFDVTVMCITWAVVLLRPVWKATEGVLFRLHALEISCKIIRAPRVLETIVLSLPLDVSFEHIGWALAKQVDWIVIVAFPPLAPFSSRVRARHPAALEHGTGAVTRSRFSEDHGYPRLPPVISTTVRFTVASPPPNGTTVNISAFVCQRGDCCGMWDLGTPGSPCCAVAYGAVGHAPRADAPSGKCSAVSEAAARVPLWHVGSRDAWVSMLRGRRRRSRTLAPRAGGRAFHRGSVLLCLRQLSLASIRKFDTLGW